MIKYFILNVSHIFFLGNLILWLAYIVKIIDNAILVVHGGIFHTEDALLSEMNAINRYIYTVLYYTILYYTILYYTILYYTILYYTILYFTILYYSVLSSIAPLLLLLSYPFNPSV